MNTVLAVFIQFLRRDFALFWVSIRTQLVNYGIIYPLLFSVVFGYVLPAIGNMLTSNAQYANIIFIGSILFVIFPVSFIMNLDFIFDLEQDRFTNYQILVLHPHLVLIEKILFLSLRVFSCAIFFYPVSKLFLGSLLDTSHVSWIKLYIILYLSCLFCSTFNVFFACTIKNISQLRNFWIRLNYPLIMLGGYLTPWHVMAKCSPALGYFALLNPLIYSTEGLRSAFSGSKVFFPFYICFIALTFFSLFFTLLSFIFFKKKMDHI